MSYVYVISGATGPLKIGASNNPSRRLRELQRKSDALLRISAIFKFDYDAVTIERRSHKALCAFKHSKEWFNVRPGVAIAAIRQAAFSLAVEMTSPNLPRYLHAATPVRQKAYRRILARAGTPKHPMAPSTAREHLGSRPKVQADYQRELAREAGRAAGRARRKGKQEGGE